MIDVKADRPSYVVFERRAIEDRAASIAAGHYVTKDVDFAIVTPIGSKDRIPRRVDEWFAQMQQQVREERLPASWLASYKAAYEAWKRGEEVPLSGTPIKGWQILSPAQQQNVISANILTVEDLASANDEARRRIGMGALDLVEKANAWLKSSQDVGKVAQELASVKAELASRSAELLALQEVNTELRAKIKRLEDLGVSLETTE